MSLMCMLGLHYWHGCKCIKCERTRDMEHNWDNKDGHKCETCGEVRSGSFALSGCKCLVCGKTHDVPRNIWSDEETCPTCGSRLSVDVMADQWAYALKDAKDYKALAAYLCSYHPYPKTIYNPYSVDHEYDRWMALWNSKMHRARMILRAAGSEAVDAMISELDRGECKDGDIANILLEIGDPKAVPILKKLLDRDMWDSSGAWWNDRIRKFVDKYPQYHEAVEKVSCAICGKIQPVTETQRCEGKRFCKGVCWSERGRVVKRLL